jgi:hypothetical protein
MDDSLLLTILQEQTKVATRTEQKVDDLNKRLFGNGQPGTIQVIHEATVKTNNDLLEAKEALGDRISEVDAAHRLDRKWLAGALAVIVLEGTAAAFYFKYLYSVFHAWLK